MELKKILSCVDHTLLAQTSTWEEIKEILDDGIKYNCASACIPPSFVKRAKEYVGNKLQICTVIGFPNGYSTTAVKMFETKDAISSGADEIDMVINIGDLKDKKYDDILNEIKLVKTACEDKILKVIIETCLLTDEEKIKMCQIVSESKADYIKTSTGFSKSGATKEDIKLFSENIAPNIKMKASGGISSLDDAIDYINLGCSRLGTSRIVKIVKSNEQNKSICNDSTY
ncbi:MAG TPA: deoxyribose-phosphate aldolase [Clostridiales bacterium]|nr:deoxyribose-phosphate aldolase [Clostridiales bacterium]